ncbi:MAG: YitT family protein [Oscillospiraceae bacterium]
MKSKFKEYFSMTAGTLVVALGVYFFKFPNNFSTGGVSGIAVLLGKLVPNISTGQFVFIINLALLVVGFMVLGKAFGGKTVYCSMLLSFSLTILEKLIPLAKPLTNQPLLELVFAVLLPSIGSALLFYSGSSTGGTDIVAMILKKYTSMDIGKALLVSDALIALSTFFIFGIETGLFSVLGLVSKSLVVDQVIASLTLFKNCITIVDENQSDAACEYITKDLHRGATIIDCRGYYTDSGKKAIISVLKKEQVSLLRDKLKSIDPHAFLIVTSTNEAYGRGFNTI